MEQDFRLCVCVSLSTGWAPSGGQYVLSINLSRLYSEHITKKIDSNLSKDTFARRTLTICCIEHSLGTAPCVEYKNIYANLRKK